MRKVRHNHFVRVPRLISFALFCSFFFFQRNTLLTPQKSPTAHGVQGCSTTR
jgi:hypothetical protein